MNGPFWKSILGLALATPILGAEKPNIVLIMADDMGYECVQVNGSTTYKTPHLNRLATEGIRFTNCFSTPICTPSRVQIMTGKYNFRNYSHFGFLNPQATTFGHRLKRQGYATCIAGKWQLNGIYHDLPGNQDSRRPQASGFDESCLWQVTQQKKSGERFADALIEVNGERRGKQLGQYGPDIFCEFLCDFIHRHRDSPFFCYYPMVLVHDPFVPTPDSPEWASGDRYQKDRRFFADMVGYADTIVGRIQQQLEDDGLAENTLLVFTGDNGTHRSITTPTTSGPVRGGKGLTIETGIHVPLFALWKGKSARGIVCDDLIDFTDFLPTLEDAVGITATVGSDGRSFLPQILGQTGNPRDHVFCHYDPRWGPMAKTPVRFARDQRYKLYHDGRFFDVRKDPLETQPLQEPLSRTAQSTLEKLQAVLDAKPYWQPPARP